MIEVLAPAKEGTPAGRLLQRRGEGGYMIIMQTLDAGARREYIESRNLARVVFSFTEGDAQCVQYHPKGVPGMFATNAGTRIDQLISSRWDDART